MHALMKNQSKESGKIRPIFLGCPPLLRDVQLLRRERMENWSKDERKLLAVIGEEEK